MMLVVRLKLDTNTLKDKIKSIVYNFILKSSDFYGIPLQNISKELNIYYVHSIDLIKELVSEEIISIQSSTNPHIIGFQHYPIDSQIHFLLDKMTSENINKDFFEEKVEFFKFKELDNGLVERK